MKVAIHYLISGILLFSIYRAFGISMMDFKNKNVCPKLLGIPACYLVLSFFAVALLTHTLRHKSVAAMLYYILITIPLLMALNGTVTELSGTVICPRTSGGTPMCYISLALCTTLLILKPFSSISPKSINK